MGIDSPFWQCVANKDFQIEIDQLFQFIERSKKDEKFTDEEIQYLIDYHNQKGDVDHSSILFNTIHSMDLETFDRIWTQTNKKINVSCFSSEVVNSIIDYLMDLYHMREFIKFKYRKYQSFIPDLDKLDIKATNKLQKFKSEYYLTNHLFMKYLVLPNVAKIEDYLFVNKVEIKKLQFHQL
ncbi:hypothetical protein TRFO_04217 [Tritrichomonas foetus]|uniref:Uncharacterized protein n=1 Tax=Tritrichomonas foetus TaxID=1144522 RepID=A0A1J4KGZ9_9EUKA|nr:hypothetical protein TRFO_04217 [Tritrichomonas foetus]|eukprot:OHT10695.1 hypothetical protein TRFO_04217 [Tritrichomonas foetus]